MPNYNDAQGVADLLSQFDFNIINEGPGDFSTQHRKYTCEFSKPGIESFTTTYQSNPDVHGQPTATDVFAAVRGTFHAIWDDPALVSTPRYAELALGMPAEEALAPLPLDLITFDDEIVDNGDKLNFYIPVTFNCDAVFGTDVCSLDNDDYLNIYVDYDMVTGAVAAHLDISLNRADGGIDELSYPLDDAERIALLPKMDSYCRHETGKGIAEYAKEVMGEPEQPVSLKAAVRESREASVALAGDDTHENIGQDAR